MLLTTLCTSLLNRSGTIDYEGWQQIAFSQISPLCDSASSAPLSMCITGITRTCAMLRATGTSLCLKHWTRRGLGGAGGDL